MARYRQVLSSISSVPIPHCLVLDRDEHHHESDIAELKRLLGDRLLLLPRREVENYLLAPEAVCEALRDAGAEPDTAKVRQLFAKVVKDTDSKRFYPGGCSDPIRDVKASAVIQEVFDSYYCPYSKPNAGLVMARWVLANGEGDLKEVFDLVAPFLKG